MVAYLRLGTPATAPPSFLFSFPIFGPRFGAPISDQLVGETAPWSYVSEETAQPFCRFTATHAH